MSIGKIAVLATLDSKSEAAAFMCDVLRRLGVEPWLMDLSLMPHEKTEADIGGDALVSKSGVTWADMAAMELLVLMLK